MPRQSKSAKIPPPATNWWANTYVMMRKDDTGPYAPGNVCWRRAENEHEAMLGLEEWDPDEPTSLPMSRERVRERAKRKDAMMRRFFDLHTRMLYRSGELDIPPERKCVWVETSPFPSGWKPGQCETIAVEN